MGFKVFFGERFYVFCFVLGVFRVVYFFRGLISVSVVTLEIIRFVLSYIGVDLLVI